MIINQVGEKVSPKNKVKILLQNYFSKFSIEEQCFSLEKLTEKEKGYIQDQLTKIKERIDRQLILK